MVVKYGSVPSRCTIKFGPVFYFHLNSYDEHINSVQVFCGYFLCDVTILEVAILKRKREKKKLLFGLLQTVLKKNTEVLHWIIIWNSIYLKRVSKDERNAGINKNRINKYSNDSIRAPMNSVTNDTRAGSIGEVKNVWRGSKTVSRERIHGR